MREVASTLRSSALRSRFGALDEDLLDRALVRRIGRQKEQFGADGPD